MSNFFLNKKGSDNIVFPEIIFMLITVVFFSMLLFFVYKSSSGAVVYEDLYVKKIAMILTVLPPGMTVNVNFTIPYNVAKENGKLTNLVVLNGSRVEVFLSSQNDGSYKVFTSNYNFEIKEDYSRADTPLLIISNLGEKK